MIQIDAYRTLIRRSSQQNVLGTRPAQLGLMHSAITRSIVVIFGACAVFSSLATPQLAQKKKCLTCHAVNKKVVGPAYEDVSKKYNSKTDAEETVITNIKKGGKGKWGDVQMPAQTDLSDAETRALTNWILGTSK